ncbi:MAG: hypothetical protein AAFX51_18560 [Cyanobacteria bacterium J06636_28]
MDTRLTATRTASFEVTTLDGHPIHAAVSTNHPYHWAPFILIGNAL